MTSVWDEIERLADLLADVRHDLAETKHRVANMLGVGPVTDRDPQKGYRVAIGLDADGNEVKSPWLPHPDSGGAASTWMPLSDGQIVGVVAPNGDPRQAFLVRAGFGGDNGPPSQDLGEVVLLRHGEVRVSATASALVIKVGGSVFTITPDAIQPVTDHFDVQGAQMTHNGKNNGDSHRHGEVIKGGDETGTPV